MNIFLEYAIPNKPSPAKIERNKSAQSYTLAVCCVTREIKLRPNNITLSQKNTFKKTENPDKELITLLKLAENYI